MMGTALHRPDHGVWVRLPRIVPPSVVVDHTGDGTPCEQAEHENEHRRERGSVLQRHDSFPCLVEKRPTDGSNSEQAPLNE